MNHYGRRYLTVSEFISHCSDLKVKTDDHELEHYEKTQVMLPVAQVVYPDEYIASRSKRRLGGVPQGTESVQYPELERLLREVPSFPREWATATDDDLYDPFDKEMGHNQYLTRPAPRSYVPWKTFTTVVADGKGNEWDESTADHYYAYWQVHQLHWIQEYPDLYRNFGLLKLISDAVKNPLHRPWSPELESLRSFAGYYSHARPLSSKFDALSLWIVLSDRERERTFAVVPEVDHRKALDDHQFDAYQVRLRRHAESIQQRYTLSNDECLQFLVDLLDLHGGYRNQEKQKLADSLAEDISQLTSFVATVTGRDWNWIQEEVGRKGGRAAWLELAELDVSERERRDARETLAYFAKEYANTLGKLGIVGASWRISDVEIDNLLDYCGKNDLWAIVHAVGELTWTTDDRTYDHRRLAVRRRVRDILNGVELLLREFADRLLPGVQKMYLSDLVREVASLQKTWKPLFDTHWGAGHTVANDLGQFRGNLVDILNDKDLAGSEDGFWARVFLITLLARNATTHLKLHEDWFYGESLGEVIQAAVYALLYSWKVAVDRNWLPPTAPVP